MELIIILILAIAIFSVAYIVKNNQKAKAEKKCPYPHEEVGYETSAPAPSPVKETLIAIKKKPATKKPAPKAAVKKTKSSTKVF
jgi:hypothetical protein